MVSAMKLSLLLARSQALADHVVTVIMQAAYGTKAVVAIISRHKRLNTIILEWCKVHLTIIHPWCRSFIDYACLVRYVAWW